MTVLFMLSAVLIFYAYAGYPLILLAAARARERHLPPGDGSKPRVTMIVTAYNEERNIEKKIRNCLELDYPSDLLEIIFVSDGSTDRTDEILCNTSGDRIRFLRQIMRSGKTKAQNAGVAIATGEILIFSDASTRLDSDAISKIVDPFRDETVGLVSGEDRWYDVARHGTNEGQGLYVKYEMAIRRLESSFGSTVSASGCFYAVRAGLRGDLSAEQIDDFAVPMRVIRAGKRVISEQDAVAWIPKVGSPEKEFQRRVRMIVGGIRSLIANAEVLNPFRYGLFSFQLFSHKVLRWLVPFLMVVAFVSSAILATGSGFFRFVLGLQILFYGFAVIGHLMRHGERLPKAFAIPYFFCGSNISILLAWLQVVRGAHFVVWEPSRS